MSSSKFQTTKRNTSEPNKHPNSQLSSLQKFAHIKPIVKTGIVKKSVKPPITQIQKARLMQEEFIRLTPLKFLKLFPESNYPVDQNTSNSQTFIRQQTCPVLVVDLRPFSDFQIQHIKNGYFSSY